MVGREWWRLKHVLPGIERHSRATRSLFCNVLGESGKEDKLRLFVRIVETWRRGGLMVFRQLIGSDLFSGGTSKT